MPPHRTERRSRTRKLLPRSSFIFRRRCPPIFFLIFQQGVLCYYLALSKAHNSNSNNQKQKPCALLLRTRERLAIIYTCVRHFFSRPHDHRYLTATTKEEEENRRQRCRKAMALPAVFRLVHIQTSTERTFSLTIAQVTLTL